MGKRECFKFYNGATGKDEYKHYTELTDRFIWRNNKILKECIYFNPGGSITRYFFKIAMNSSAGVSIAKQHPDYPTVTKGMLDYFYDKEGQAKESLTIKRVDRLVNFGLKYCPTGIAPPDPVEPGEPIKPVDPAPPHIKPGSGKETKIVRIFNVNSSTFHIDFKCKTLLRYGSVNDTISRGKAKLYLYRGNELIDTIWDVDYNYDGSFSKTYEGLAKGEYRIVMELEDTYQDTKEIHFKVKTQIREVKTTVGGTANRDDSKYTMVVRNGSGGVVEEIVMDCNGTCRECVRLEVPAGETYTLTGVFYRTDDITVGGPFDSGAAIEITEGVVKYDVVTRAFPPGEPIKGGTGGVSGNIPPPVIDLPIPGWDGGETDIEPGDGEPGTFEDDYLWVDVIEVQSAEGGEVDEGEADDIIESHICYPLGTYMDLDVVGMDLSSFMDANPDIRVNELITGEIDLHLTNPSNSDITVQLDFDVDDNFDGCGGGGEINYHGGGFEFWGYDRIVGEDIEDVTATSSLNVSIDEYLPNHTVIGGCNGSYAEVHIKQGGNIVKTVIVNENTTPRVMIDNLFQYGDSDFDVEIVTHQKGEDDVQGYDLRSMFAIRDFKLDAMFELNADNFDSKLDFYMNNELKFTSDVIGSGDHYFDVKKGLNKYKMIFSTNLYDYNWDYVEIPWIRLTNWMCDAHEVTPYCDKGRGDKCVEALIGCVLGLLPKPIPKGCVTITYYDHETGEVLKQFTRYGYTVGEYIIEAENFAEFEIVGDASKTVTVDESGICTHVDFYYRRTYRRCVYVYHMDCETGQILRKVPYYNLVPGKHYFNPVSIPNYRARPVDAVKFEAINTVVPIECEPIYFCYDWVGDKDPYLDCLIILHREYGNIENILETEQIINLTEGELEVHAKQYPGYRVVGSSVKFLNMRNITDPMECLSVSFEYEKIPLDCVIVKFVDRTTEKVLDTDFYYGLLPGEYTYDAKAFDGYKLVSEKSYTILITEESITDECKELTFLYEPISKGCALGRKIWIFT